MPPNRNGFWKNRSLAPVRFRSVRSSGATPAIVADQIGRVPHRGTTGGNFGTTASMWPITPPRRHQLAVPYPHHRRRGPELQRRSTKIRPFTCCQAATTAPGFPTHAHYYQTTSCRCTQFQSGNPVATGAGVGDFVCWTPTGDAHAVLDEISGNIYTGNSLPCSTPMPQEAGMPPIFCRTPWQAAMAATSCFDEQDSGILCRVRGQYL